METLRQIKEKDIGSEAAVEKRRGKKRAKGPNPLSCMKKKKKLATAVNHLKTNGDQPASSEKRKRKRVRIAKHVKQELAMRQQASQTPSSSN